MKRKITKCFKIGILSLSLSIGTIIAPYMNLALPLTLTAFAGRFTAQGGLQHVTLGKHDGTRVSAYFSDSTRVQLKDKNGNVLMDLHFPRGMNSIYCSSETYTITMFLDDSKVCDLSW